MRRHFRVGGDLVDFKEAKKVRWLKDAKREPWVRRRADEHIKARQRQLAELLESRVGKLETQQEQLSGGVESAPKDARYVLWGNLLNAVLTDEKLHSNLVGGDLHIPKTHAASHRANGSDPLTNWVDNETPAGAVDNNNKVFTLANTPATADSVVFYVRWGTVGGFIVYLNAVQFTMAAAVLTIVAVETAPPTGSTVRVSYRI